MFEAARATKLSRASFLVLAVFLLSAFVLSVLGCVPAVTGPRRKAIKMNKAYTFAGVIIDRSRKVKRNQTTAEVKVVDKIPSGRNRGKRFDVVFLVRPSAISKGKILTLTSGPVKKCRPFLKKFLTKTLSPKRIKKAYKGAKLATVDKDSDASSLAKRLTKNRWLKNCAAKPKGKVDVFKTLIVNASDA
ncbi:MAG: hypothetical protein ACE5HC_07110 [Candidatus Binatia bacterium]